MPGRLRTASRPFEDGDRVAVVLPTRAAALVATARPLAAAGNYVGEKSLDDDVASDRPLNRFA